MKRLACAMGMMLAGSAALPAFAQERLPATSRGERQVNELNRSMQSDQRYRGAVQQQQFENNQIRNQIRPIQPIQPPTVIAPPR